MPGLALVGDEADRPPHRSDRVRYAIRDEASLVEAAGKLVKLHARFAVQSESDTDNGKKCESTPKVSA